MPLDQISQDKTFKKYNLLDRYKSTLEKDGTIIIHDVPIFAEISRDVENAGEIQTYHYDGDWIKTAVDEARRREHHNGSIPTLYIEHEPGEELDEQGNKKKKLRKIAGFFRNQRAETRMYNGKPTVASFADLIIVDPKAFELIQSGQLPGISVEISESQENNPPTFSAAALLNTEPSALKFPPILVENPVQNFSEKMRVYKQVSDKAVSVICFSEFRSFEELGDVPRDEMPQFKGNDFSKFVEALVSGGIEIKKETISASSLEPTQDEIDQKKVDSIADKIEKGEFDSKPVLISSDNYILDGHHRWAGSVQSSPDFEIDVLRIDLPIDELLPFANEFLETGELPEVESVEEFGEKEISYRDSVKRLGELAREWEIASKEYIEILKNTEEKQKEHDFLIKSPKANGQRISKLASDLIDLGVGEQASKEMFMDITGKVYDLRKGINENPNTSVSIKDPKSGYEEFLKDLPPSDDPDAIMQLVAVLEKEAIESLDDDNEDLYFENLMKANRLRSSLGYTGIEDDEKIPWTEEFAARKAPERQKHSGEREYLIRTLKERLRKGVNPYNLDEIKSQIKRLQNMGLTRSQLLGSIPDLKEYEILEFAENESAHRESASAFLKKQAELMDELHELHDGRQFLRDIQASRQSLDEMDVLIFQKKQELYDLKHGNMKFDEIPETPTMVVDDEYTSKQEGKRASKNVKHTSDAERVEAYLEEVYPHKKFKLNSPEVKDAFIDVFGKEEGLEKWTEKVEYQAGRNKELNDADKEKRNSRLDPKAKNLQKGKASDVPLEYDQENKTFVAPNGLPKNVEMRGEIYQFTGTAWRSPSGGLSKASGVANMLSQGKAKPLGDEMVIPSDMSLKFRESIEFADKPSADDLKADLDKDKELKSSKISTDLPAAVKVAGRDYLWKPKTSNYLSVSLLGSNKKLSKEEVADLLERKQAKQIGYTTISQVRQDEIGLKNKELKQDEKDAVKELQDSLKMNDDKKLRDAFIEIAKTELNWREIDELVPGSKKKYDELIAKIKAKKNEPVAPEGGNLSEYKRKTKSFAESDEPRLLQSIVVSKSIAKDENEAKRMATKHGNTKNIVETDSSWRFPQRDSDEFDSETYKTVKDEGVALIMAKLKKLKKKTVENAENEKVAGKNEPSKAVGGATQGLPTMPSVPGQMGELKELMAEMQQYAVSDYLPGAFGVKLLKAMASLVGADPDSDYENAQLEKNPNYAEDDFKDENLVDIGSLKVGDKFKKPWKTASPYVKSKIYTIIEIDKYGRINAQTQYDGPGKLNGFTSFNPKGLKVLPVNGNFSEFTEDDSPEKPKSKWAFLLKPPEKGLVHSFDPVELREHIDELKDTMYSTSDEKLEKKLSYFVGKYEQALEDFESFNRQDSENDVDYESGFTRGEIESEPYSRYSETSEQGDSIPVAKKILIADKKELLSKIDPRKNPFLSKIMNKIYDMIAEGTVTAEYLASYLQQIDPSTFQKITGLLGFAEGQEFAEESSEQIPEEIIVRKDDDSMCMYKFDSEQGGYHQTVLIGADGLPEQGELEEIHSIEELMDLGAEPVPGTNYISLGGKSEFAEESVESLEKQAALGDPSAKRKLDALSKRGEKDPVSRAKRDLENNDSRFRIKGVRDLEEIGAKEAVPDLIDIAKNDNNTNVRFEAIWALRGLGAKEAIPVLSEIAKNDSNREVRNEAIWALRKLGLKEGVDFSESQSYSEEEEHLKSVTDSVGPDNEDESRQLFKYYLGKIVDKKLAQGVPEMEIEVQVNDLIGPDNVEFFWDELRSVFAKKFSVAKKEHGNFSEFSKPMNVKPDKFAETELSQEAEDALAELKALYEQESSDEPILALIVKLYDELKVPFELVIERVPESQKIVELLQEELNEQGFETEPEKGEFAVKPLVKSHSVDWSLENPATLEMIDTLKEQGIIPEEISAEEILSKVKQGKPFKSISESDKSPEGFADAEKPELPEQDSLKKAVNKAMSPREQRIFDLENEWRKKGKEFAEGDKSRIESILDGLDEKYGKDANFLDIALEWLKEKMGGQPVTKREKSFAEGETSENSEKLESILESISGWDEEQLEMLLQHISEMESEQSENEEKGDEMAENLNAVKKAASKNGVDNSPVNFSEVTKSVLKGLPPTHQVLFSEMLRNQQSQKAEIAAMKLKEKRADEREKINAEIDRVAKGALNFAEIKRETLAIFSEKGLSSAMDSLTMLGKFGIKKAPAPIQGNLSNPPAEKLPESFKKYESNPAHFAEVNRLTGLYNTSSVRKETTLDQYVHNGMKVKFSEFRSNGRVHSI